MIYQKRLLSFTATAFVTASLNLSASAADPVTRLTTANAVGACTPNGGGTPRYDWDGFYNDSSSQNMYLDCSLPLISANAFDLGRGSGFYVLGKNRSVTESLTCTFKVVTTDGFVAYEGGSMSLAAGSSDVAMYMSYWDLNLASPAYASCKIPKKQGASAYSGITGLWFFATNTPP